MKKMILKESIYVSIIIQTEIALLKRIKSIVTDILNMIEQVLIHCTNFSFTLQCIERSEVTDIFFEILDVIYKHCLVIL